ncbi:hypothetical protein SDC9_170499 [bioreactor metagenome]|uniref:Uncharacterized protein n=1 Tax=bioreactor metagenome TaxID=1076179 RepID=A0A645GGW1_9ZZZZ
MQQIRAVGLRRRQDRVDIQIALVRRTRADADALIRKAHGQAPFVIFRVDRNAS